MIMRVPAASIVCFFAASFASAQQKPTSEMERAVEEFKVQTRELGLRADSPQPKSRSGGVPRQWHGRVYENWRNDVLDAVPHEIRQRGENKSLLRRNQFGFNAAGPLVVPKLLDAGRSTYFSLSYEGVRERISRSYLTTIPTGPQRTGDYSHVVDQAGEVLPIFDPLATQPNPAFAPSLPVSLNNLQYLREPFPGNRIPTSRLDPVAQKALTWYPFPNTDVGPFFRNNYFVISPETNTANGMIGKIDHTVRDRHRLTLEMAFSNGFLGAARYFPNAANPGPADRSFETRRASVEHVFTVSSRTVNTATFEVTTQSSKNGEAEDETSYAPQLGIPGPGGSGFPQFSYSGYLSMGRSHPFSHNANNSFAWTDALSVRHGRHSLRLVAQYLRYQVNTFGPQYPAGSYSFGSGLTSLPGIVNTGDSFAGFLLGGAEYATQSIVVSPSYFRRSQASVSLRDRYEISRSFTVSIAAGIERSSPRTEKSNRQSTVDLTAINPANGRPGALVAAGAGGYGRSFQPDRLRLEPSASLAWNPRGNPRNVVRAAFVRSYSAIPIYNGQWGTQGFSIYPTYISPNVQLAPAAVISQGLPPISEPIPDLRPDAANDTVADLVDMTDRQPTYQSASLTYEREAPGSVVLTAGIAYSGGKNLLVGDGSANPNAIPLSALSYRDRLNNEDFNRSLRPYPQYKGFELGGLYPLGRYERDAAFLRVEKRASHGLSVSAYYEFSKQLDDYSGPFGKQDFFDRQNEWALTPWNNPHRVTFSYVYELPLGSNKPFLNFPDWRHYLADGWSLSGMGTITSGNPMYLRPSFNNTGGVVQALHVDVVPGVDPQVPNPGPDLWYNPAAFAQPADFTLGDASRTHPSLRNPGEQNYDVTLNKRFALAADRTLEFTAAGFNFINHANWNDPDNVIGPASAPNVNAGKIIGSHGGRVIQLGLRFSF